MDEQIDLEKERLRVSILDEIKNAKQEAGNLRIHFSNLWYNLSDKESPEGGNRRRFSKQSGRWTERRSEYLKNNESYDREIKKHSELRNNQTDGEFYNSIDNKIKELCLSEEKIQELISKAKSGHGEALDELYEMVENLYVELRLFGYNHQDLIE